MTCKHKHTHTHLAQLEYLDGIVFYLLDNASLEGTFIHQDLIKQALEYTKLSSKGKETELTQILNALICTLTVTELYERELEANGKLISRDQNQIPMMSK